MKYLIAILALIPALALSLAASCANAYPVTCLPAELAGTGSTLAMGSNVVGRWVGWWCPGEAGPTVFACRKGSCLPSADLSDKVQRIVSYPSVSTLWEMTYSMPSYDTVADVWKPDFAKLLAVKPK